MQLLTIGLNHQTASIEIRERAAFSTERSGGALSDLVDRAGAAEAAILSTCNRTEIYCGHEPNRTPYVQEWLSDYAGIGMKDLERNLYHYPDEAAVRHAFRVASGLDSMVLGEPQILGQMKDAFRAANEAGATGKLLNRLFQHTFNVAKQVRTDTEIGANAVSIAYTGVNLARRIFTRLEDQKVLLVGAGETIELVARHLVQNGVGNITIANRSIEKARKLASESGNQAITLAQIPERLQDVDIVVTSTASTLPILGKGTIERVLKARKQQPMFILDLAVPRDVEPEVGSLDNVYLYTVDDLKNSVDENRELRLKEAQKAEQIIDLQVVRFMRWVQSLDSVSSIRTFRDGLESLRDKELDKAVRRLSKGGDPEDILRQFARDYTNKIAHKPTQVIRQADSDGDTGLLNAVRKIFGN